MRVARSDLARAPGDREAPGDAASVRAAVAKLAAIAFAPAPDFAGIEHRTRVLLAGGDIDDIGQRGALAIFNRLRGGAAGGVSGRRAPARNRIVFQTRAAKIVAQRNLLGGDDAGRADRQPRIIGAAVSELPLGAQTEAADLAVGAYDARMRAPRGDLDDIGIRRRLHRHVLRGGRVIAQLTDRIKPPASGAPASLKRAAMMRARVDMPGGREHIYLDRRGRSGVRPVAQLTANTAISPTLDAPGGARRACMLRARRDPVISHLSAAIIHAGIRGARANAALLGAPGPANFAALRRILRAEIHDALSRLTDLAGAHAIAAMGIATVDLHRAAFDGLDLANAHALLFVADHAQRASVGTIVEGHVGLMGVRRVGDIFVARVDDIRRRVDGVRARVGRRIRIFGVLGSMRIEIDDDVRPERVLAGITRVERWVVDILVQRVRVQGTPGTSVQKQRRE